MSDRYKAISHPIRRDIIRLLRAKPLSVGEIVEKLAMPLSTVSQHLGVLKSVSLVRTTKSGTTITYFLMESVLDELAHELTWLFSKKRDEHD